MKKLIYIIFSFMMSACLFTYDPAPGVLDIRNNSDEAIYVYLKCGNTDSLPFHPKLELFHYFSHNEEDTHGNPIEPYFASPEYRINAYAFGSLKISGARNNPNLPCDENEVTLFFITEKTMRSYDWEEIYKNQMFVKKITITEEELKKNDWVVIYD